MPRSTQTRKVPHSAKVLGDAIQRAYRESPRVGKQEVLADLLGIDQTSVSKMVTGVTAVTVERIHEIEDHCGLPRGQILVWGGAVSDAALSKATVAKVVPLAPDRRRPGLRAAKPKRPSK